MSLETDILTYGNRAQSKILSLASIVEEQLRQGLFAEEALEQAAELMQFQDALFDEFNSWSDADKATWIAWNTDHYELSEFAFTGYDSNTLPIVVVADTSGGAYVTHPELNAVKNELQLSIDELDARVVVLENFDYSTIIPQSLLDDVAQLKIDVINLTDFADALSSSLMSLNSDLSNHKADTTKHITAAERNAWNAKPTQQQLADGLDGKADVDHTHEIGDIDGLADTLNSLQEQISEFPEPEDGNDGITPVIAIGTVVSGDAPSVTLDPDAPAQAPIMNFVLQKGDPGKDFDFDATDLLANRADYDGEDVGFKFLAVDTGNYYVHADDGWGPAIPFKGWNGWTPLLGLFTVSADKEVFEIISWIGGSGPLPQLPVPVGVDPADVRYFIGASGITTIANDAKNVKGAVGPDGPVTPFVINEEGTDKTIYDTQSRGFAFLDTTTGKVFFKVTDTLGDWSAGYQWVGPDSDIAGPPGASAYELAVDNGFTGTEAEWLMSLMAQAGRRTIEMIAHGFTELNVLGITEGGVLELFDGSNEYMGIVAEVVDVDNFILQNSGFIEDPGIDLGEYWYAQNDGTLDPATASDVIAIIGIAAGVGAVKPALGGSAVGSGEGATMVIPITAHGFSQWDVLGTADSGSTPVLYDGMNDYVGVVTEVLDTDHVKVQKCGYLDASFITEGEYYYAQDDGSIGTTSTALLLIIGVGGTIGAMYDRRITGLGALFPGVYFVSPTGNDVTAMPGDPTLPFTPAGAAALLVAGETMSFLPGAYNIASNLFAAGVAYGTFGGKATLTVTTANVKIWDYSAYNGSLPFTVSGDFDFVLNATGSAIIKSYGGFNNLSTTFKVSNINLKQCDCAIDFATTFGASLYEASVYIESSCTGRLLRSAGGGSGGSGTIVKLSIVSDSSTEPIQGINSPPWQGFLFEINFRGTASGLTTNYLGISQAQLVISQPTGAVTHLADTTVIQGKGGTFFCAQTTIGNFNNAIVAAQQYQTINLDGSCKDCIIDGGQAQTFTINASTTNCEFKAATTIEMIINGTHVDFKSNYTFYLLQINGKIKMKAGEQLQCGNNLEISRTGKVIGNIDDAVVKIVNSSSLYNIIAGQIKNVHAGTSARAVSIIGNGTGGGGGSKLRLDGAVLQAGANADYSIYHIGSSAIDDSHVQMFNKSYANLAAGTNSNGVIVFDIGVSGDLVVDASVKVLSI